MTVNKILNEFAESFSKKIDSDYIFTVQLEFTDINDKNIWQLDIKDNKVFIFNEERYKSDETYTLTVETLEKLYNNKLSPLTAFLQEPSDKGIMCSLIDIKNKKEENRFWDGDKLEQQKLDFFNKSHIFTSEFFSKDFPTKIIVDNNNCIKHNNVNAIGLYSDFKNGTLHAYFSIKTDEILNYPPIDCSIYVLHGKGKLYLNGNEYEIKEKQYYHFIPERNISIKNIENTSLDILFFGNTKRYKIKYKK